MKFVDDDDDDDDDMVISTSSVMRLRTLSGRQWEDCFSDNISVLSALEPNLEVYTTMR